MKFVFSHNLCNRVDIKQLARAFASFVKFVFSYNLCNRVDKKRAIVLISSLLIYACVRTRALRVFIFAALLPLFAASPCRTAGYIMADRMAVKSICHLFCHLSFHRVRKRVTLKYLRMRADLLNDRICAIRSTHRRNTIVAPHTHTTARAPFRFTFLTTTYHTFAIRKKHFGEGAIHGINKKA